MILEKNAGQRNFSLATWVGDSGLLCMLLTCGAILEFVPSFSAPTALFIMALAATLVLPTTNRTPKLRHFTTRTDLLLAAFLIWSYVCTFLFVQSPTNGWEPSIRGMVPFIFLGIWYPLSRKLPSSESYVARAILFASVVWLIKILSLAAVAYFDGLGVHTMRLTLTVVDSVLPFALVAIPILCFADTGLSKTSRLILIALFLLVVVWSGYRSMLLIIAAMLLYASLKRFGIGKTLAVIALSLAGIGIWDQQLSDESMLGQLRSRFETVEDEIYSGRALEWQYALEQFRDSPIVGRGFGWQVPSWITFEGMVLPDDFEIPDSAGYVHNFIAYFLMDVGIIGAVLYILLLLGSLASGWKTIWIRIAILALMTFCLVEATFRLIQFNLLLVAIWIAIQERTSSLKFGTTQSRAVGVAPNR